MHFKTINHGIRRKLHLICIAIELFYALELFYVLLYAHYNADLYYN
jgi:hypothetical protein